MQYRYSLRKVLAILVVCLLSPSSHAGQGQPGYDYPLAAQEITQLFWLAETANTCGWATRAEADEFEHFAVRFLAAHLSGMHRSAFISMISETGFQPGVQRVAFENRTQNCAQLRWKNGWSTFKAAADENATRY